MPASDTKEKERITARVPRDVRRTLEEAANLSGTTLNQFLVNAALREAHALIERDRIIALTQRDTNMLLALLENPPEPNERLKAAARAYKDDRQHDKDRSAEPVAR